MFLKTVLCQTYIIECYFDVKLILGNLVIRSDYKWSATRSVCMTSAKTVLLMTLSNFNRTYSTVLQSHHQLVWWPPYLYHLWVLTFLICWYTVYMVLICPCYCCHLGDNTQFSGPNNYSKFTVERIKSCPHPMSAVAILFLIYIYIYIYKCLAEFISINRNTKPEMLF